MLLESYRLELSRIACRPEAQTLHCIALLDQDIGPAIPYLNAVLGGTSYNDEPSVTFKVHGRLISVHPQKIAINAIRDQEEAEKILAWLKREINTAWEERETIEPFYEAAPRPKVYEILKRLPKTNCMRCGQLTCMVFAAMMAEGGKGVQDCPELTDSGRLALQEYLGTFKFLG